MAKARVELLKSATHTARGRTFRKGQVQILTNSADILYYQQQPEFSVIVLEEDKPAAPTKVKAVAAPVEEEDDPITDEELDAADAADKTASTTPADGEEVEEVTLPPKPAKTPAVKKPGKK